VPLVVTQYDEHSPALSPDDQWLAYVSDESGQAEVYIRPFPDVGAGLWLISTGGGREPVWSADGTELYFRNGRGEMVAAAITVEDDQVSVRSLTPLFSTAGYERDDVHPTYAIDPAGSGRFLMIRRLGDLFGRIVMVQNLGQELPEPERD
jgi:serine/threonine-protein kinase